MSAVCLQILAQVAILTLKYASSSATRKNFSMTFKDKLETPHKCQNVWGCQISLFSQFESNNYFFPRAFYFFKVAAKDLEVTPQILRKKDDLERWGDWVPPSQTLKKFRLWSFSYFLDTWPNSRILIYYVRGAHFWNCLIRYGWVMHISNKCSQGFQKCSIY